VYGAAKSGTRDSRYLLYNETPGLGLFICPANTPIDLETVPLNEWEPSPECSHGTLRLGRLAIAPASQFRIGNARFRFLTGWIHLLK